MSKVFYDKKSNQYRSLRYSVFSSANNDGDEVFTIYDEWGKVSTRLTYETRAEANREAKRLEKIVGALRVAR